MSLEEKRTRIVEEMNYLPDRFERFTYLVDYGRNQAAFPKEFRTDTFLIEGCQSLLWLVPELKDGVCLFKAESDSSMALRFSPLIKMLSSSMLRRQASSQGAAQTRPQMDASGLGPLAIKYA